MPRDATRPRLRDRGPLLAVSVLAPMVELAALWVFGLSANRAMALQVGAPSPWGEFHDVRWLLVIHNSWFALALEVVGFAVARTLLNSVIVRQAWPGTSTPSMPRQVWHQGWFTLGTFVVLLPWTALGFGVSVVSVSWLFFAALPPVVVVALVIHHGSVEGGWWHRIPPLRSVGWVAFAFLIETVAGLVIGAAPAALWLPLAGATGLFNAWAWRGVVGAVTGQRRPARWVPLAPAVVIGMVAVVIVGATLSFDILRGRRANVAVADPRVRPVPTGAPVLVVSGFDSVLAAPSPPPVPGPYNEVRFSYRGLTAGGQPLAYTAADTHQSIPVLVRLMASEVGALHRRTGQPVSIVAESEGSLVARVYVASAPHAMISHLILLSPLDEPGRVFYPPAGRQGYGLLGGWILRGLSHLLGGISPVNLAADSPLLRSIVDHAGDLRGLLSCPARPVSEALLVPLADAVADAAPPAPGIPTIVVPAFHGGLLTNHGVQLDLARLLAGDPVTPNPVLTDTDTAVRLAAAAWQIPSLPLSLYPTGGDDHPSCDAMTASVRAWIGSSTDTRP